MASSASISGLSSGLDTATIISQLMQLESAPQTRLKTKVTDTQTVVSSLQSINTKFATLASKAETLAKTTAWSPLTATSSNSAVSVTTTSSASPTSLSLTVTSVAAAHRIGYTDAHALTDTVTGASTSVIINRFDGSPQTIDTGDGTLQGLVTAINSATNDTGLRATAIKVADGSYKLQVEATTTGASTDFEITASDGSPLLGGSTVRAGSDAAIDLGTGITATSTSNTFTDLMPGVTLTLGSAATSGTTSTISVTRDSASLATSMSSFVDAINDVLKSVDSASAYNSTSKKAGTLAGESSVRDLRDQLLAAVYPSDGTSLASLGIQVTRDGLLSFDSATFTQAYTADPTAVTEKMDKANNGFVQRIYTVANGASDSTDGIVTLAIQGRTTEITRLNKSISDWDDRLELRRTTLERQFTALETALNQMTSQSNWLSSQVSSLSSSSG